MKTANDRKYAKTDEWVKVEGMAGTIGISDYAQDQLSDIVYVEFMKEPGEQIKKGEVFATIESVKAAADMNAPVSGTVNKVNEALIASPELLNSDPFGAAWMGVIDMTDASELDDLMSSGDYETYCESR